MRRLIAAAVVLTGLVACGSDGNGAGSSPAASPEPTQTRFQEAYDAAGVTSQYIEIEDDGASIVVDGPDDDTNTNTFYPDLAQLLAQLNVPDYVVTQIDNTTSLQGRLEASWDGIEASWTYHPDNGLDLVLVDTELA